MQKNPAILVIDEDEGTRLFIERLFETEDYELIGSRDVSVAIDILSSMRQPVVALISSTTLPAQAVAAKAALTTIRACHLDLAIIYLLQSYEVNAPAVVEEMQLTFLRKPLNVSDMLHAVAAQTDRLGSSAAAAEDHAPQPIRATDERGEEEHDRAAPRHAT